jgi:hypothetical protein
MIVRSTALWISLSGFFLILTTPCLSRPALADAERSAAEFLNGSKPRVREIFNQPSSNQARRALGMILERKSIAPSLLTNLLSNPLARPYLEQLLPTLSQLDRVPGIRHLVQRIASGHDPGVIRGGVFEIRAGLALKGSLVRFGGRVNNQEVDILLSDGIGEVKSFDERHEERGLEKAKQQLKNACQGTCPGVLILPNYPADRNSVTFSKMSEDLPAGLTVYSLDPTNSTLRKIFSSGPRQSQRSLNRSTSEK